MIATPFARAAAIAGLAAGLAVLPGPGAASGCGAAYTIRSGDTLAGIAERCGTSVQALVQANPVILNPAQISIGWELTIPGARASLGPETEIRPRARSEAAETAVAAGTYEVQPGDSFAGIATALQLPMRALMAANEGVDPFALAPGQVLQLPAGGASAEQPAETGDAEADETGGAGEGSGAGSGPSGATAGTDDQPGADPDRAETIPSGPGPDSTVEPVTLQGRVRRGTECPVLETPEGATYSLVSAEYGFAPGEYVEITGEMVELSFCSEGQATIRVTSMTTVPAPQGS